MAKSIVKYYKGYLRCQFNIKDSSVISSSEIYRYQHKLKLEPRFRFFQYHEISENDFFEVLKHQESSFIFHDNEENVEFYKNNDSTKFDPQNSFVRKVEKIIFLLKKENETHVNNEEYLFDKYLHNQNDKEKFYSSFYAYKENDFFGKLDGIAWLKTEVIIEDVVKPKEVTTIEKLSPSSVGISKTIELTNPTIVNEEPTPSQSRGCFSSRGIQGSSINAIDQNRGCFGGYGNSKQGCFNSPSYSNGCFPNNGCFPSNGCFSGSGCFSNLGCLPWFILLGLLGLLFWLLVVNYNHLQNAFTPKIIHDTVKVEVIKERIDTLQIIKKDTISFVDSTSKVEFETVSLPNVQFFTNSDVLIPSSAKDLQLLAEFLNKNDSLNATIVGHTDNIGKSDKNEILSQKRAESVKKFLVSLGISSDRLNAIGKGANEPKATNDTEEGRMLNRRVEVILSSKEITKVKRTKINETDQTN